ncbi:hypothetical protein BDQ17DRAFT_1414521 [Cyathus striatus]|nr:hypothetical protein BDQ17DRAFT_1414521 [Cyathus striatus]
MGQSSSRVQANADSRRLDSGPVSSSPDNNITSPPISDPEPPSSSRRSVRRSLINLVKPSNSSTSSGASSSTGSRRTDAGRSDGGNGNGSGVGTQTARPRRWRNSIWGKIIGIARRSRDRGQGERVVDVLEKGKEREVEGTTDEEANGAAAETLFANVVAASPSAHPNKGLSLSIPPQPPLATPPQRQPTPIPEALQPRTQAPQFPPPGTLVVVQGIVHTTDNPRACTQQVIAIDEEQAFKWYLWLFFSFCIWHGNAEARFSCSSDEATNALETGMAFDANDNAAGRVTTNGEAIMSEGICMPEDERRGREAVGGHADRSEAQLLLDSGENGSANPVDRVDESGLRVSADGDVRAVGDNAGGDGNASAEAEGRDGEHLAPSISSNSIDVLGTLLSVAAAATAASLLTGSSEPILAPESSSGSSSTQPQPASAGAAARHPYAAPALPATAPTDMPHDRSERMRQAWASIRERLGLRSGQTAAAGANAQGQEVGQRGPQDVRDMMLQEMARAFHMGLGLGNTVPPPTVPSTEEEGREREDGPAEPPPEGSFERFLVDLQADLRTALSPGGAQEPDAVTDGREAGEGRDRQVEHREPEQLETTQAVASDVAQASTPVTPARDPIQTRYRHNGGGSGRIDATGRINWWRLYRFPAIVPPGHAHRAVANAAAGSVPAATPDAAQAPSPLTTSFAQPPSSTPPMSSTELPSISTSPSEVPRVQLPPVNTVIPVIVVGLQSVNGRVDIVTRSKMNKFLPSLSKLSRVMSWMAAMLSGIRTGCQRAAPNDAATGAGEMPLGRIPTDVGSRTFLIYVIGGYYPPDHTIVTNGPNSFESFEALLELGELLGQVKPPTASREDIENSGLEVITSQQLRQYEKDGKVSSNCIERCLICLDEYESEDEVRVMGCRHAFHRSCVDKWLETGRNNCPACRSTGVSTETNATRATSEAL